MPINVWLVSLSCPAGSYQAAGEGASTRRGALPADVILSVLDYMYMSPCRHVAIIVDEPPLLTGPRAQ